MPISRERLGSLLDEVLAERAPELSYSPAEVEAKAAALRASFAQIRKTSQQPAVSEADLVAFLIEGRALSHAQQRALFADPGLREQFRALKAQHAVALAPRADTTSSAEPAAAPNLLAMPSLRAAATDPGARFSRKLAGGELQIHPAGVGNQVYVVFTLDDAAANPRILVVERARDMKLARIALPPADDSEILLVKDLDLPADAELIDLLRDPSSTGAFLR
jgi:hypothetical protein